MRTKISERSVAVWLSAWDTEDWASRPNAAWPCSTLSGKRLFAYFDTNGLCDLAINGGKGDQDCDATELSAMCADYLDGKLPKDHPCYNVACGQFIAH